MLHLIPDESSIYNLMTEAGSAGDAEQVDLCKQALCDLEDGLTTSDAIQACETALREARAMID